MLVCLHDDAEPFRTFASRFPALPCLLLWRLWPCCAPQEPLVCGFLWLLARQRFRSAARADTENFLMLVDPSRRLDITVVIKWTQGWVSLVRIRIPVRVFEFHIRK